MTTKTKLEAMRLPDLWQRFAAATGSKSRSPNKNYLIKAILDAEKQKRSNPKPRSPAAVKRADTRRDERPRLGRFSGMTVDALRALYEEKVGRPTDSTDEAYLKWKVREAEKGRIAVGPVRRRKRDEPMVAVTLRFAKSELDRFDQVLQAAGAKNRTRFLMAAIGKAVESLGEAELGAALAGRA